MRRSSSSRMVLTVSWSTSCISCPSQPKAISGFPEGTWQLSNIGSRLFVMPTPLWRVTNCRLLTSTTLEAHTLQFFHPFALFQNKNGYSWSSNLPTMLEYPPPTTGASLILAFRPTKVLILGSGPLAASRAFSALEANSEVYILAHGGLEHACDELKWRSSQGQVVLADWGQDVELELGGLEKYLDSTPGISLACITDTAITQQRRDKDSCERIYRVLKARNIQVNTTDMPELCDFTFTSTHRFSDSPLQIGVTTNGQGCRLASRIRRDIVSRLPATAPSAVSTIGQLRSLAKSKALSCTSEDDSEEDSGITTPNRPVPTRSSTETELESARRRLKWVAQVSEYWPLSKLASLTPSEMSEVLEGEVPDSPITESLRNLNLPKSIVHALPNSNRGRIFLVGSGPGHPSLLTQATHTVLTKLADLVLSDKLVPDAVLALIPKTVEIRIAKKFPGNAEGAQQEMMEAAIEAANRGLTVVRVRLSLTPKKNQN